MPQQKSDCRWGQACPAFFVIAKSAEAEKAGATQHSAKQLAQSARRLRRPPSEASSACLRFSDNVRGLLFWAYVISWGELETFTPSTECFGRHPRSRLPIRVSNTAVSLSLICSKYT